MSSFIPEDGFYLYEPSSIHTFSVTRSVSKYEFNLAYDRLKNDYIQSYSKYSKNLLESFPNKYDDFEPDKSTHSIRKVFREIPVRNGISVRLSFCKNALNYNERHCKHIKTEYAESNYVTLILNPELMVSSHNTDFNAESHNYINIAPKDYNFWLEYDKYYKQFIREWNLPFMDFVTGYPKRLDLSATIKVPSDFNKCAYLEFISKSPRRYSYSEKEFYRSGQNDHQSMARNYSQAITIYDKNFEQLSKFNNELFDEYLRFENQLNGQKIKNIIRLYISKGYINPDIKSSLYEFIWFKAYVMANISHLVMIESMDRIYPYGDIIDIQQAYRRIKNSKKLYGINFQESTKNDLRFLLNSFLKCKTYDDTKNVEKNLRGIYGDQKYRRLLNLLEDMKIFPICISKNSWLSENRFIGPRDMFVSSIFNSFPELNSGIDNTFLSIPDGAITDLLK